MRPFRVLPLLLLPGCYAYRPLAAPEPAPGAAVQVDLTDEGVRRLAAMVGPDVEQVQGRVLQADSNALDLSVTEVENSRREPTSWNGERVELPQAYVRRIQVRRLSPGGTGLLGGAVAAGLVAASRLFGGQGSAEGLMGSPGSQSH